MNWCKTTLVSLIPVWRSACLLILDSWGYVSSYQGKNDTLTNVIEQRHSKIMQTCTLFSTFTSWFSRELETIDPDLSGSIKPSSMHRQQWSRFQNDKRQSQTKSTSSGITTPQLEMFLTNLKKFELNFGRHMHILLDELNHFAATETVVLLGLCARLSDVHQGTEFSGPGRKTNDCLDIWRWT